MSKLKSALELASQGFYVFPLEIGGKKPVFKRWPQVATRETHQIEYWWMDNPEANIGIYTGKFASGQALLVVDIDNKGNKKGDEVILKLEMEEGREFTPTMEVVTPSGGRHLIYVVDIAVKQGVNVLGDGIDIRSSGGYIVGPGSEI